jgi:hypothetical protein
MATAPLLEALAFVPTAVLFRAVALLAAPNAELDCELAVLPSPKAALLPPEAVAKLP